jgi:hypothetical protein
MPKPKNIPRLGGQAIKNKYGREYFSQLAKKRWAKHRASKQDLPTVPTAT